MKTKEIFMQTRQHLEKVANDIQEGNIDPIEIARELFYFKKDIEPIEKQIFESAFVETEKYNKDELLNIGVKYTGGGYTYSYDHIPEWNDLKNKMNEIEDRAKAAFLQSVKDTDAMMVTGGGEIVIPAIAKGRKQGISFIK